jgi:hypothetical protein
LAYWNNYINPLRLSRYATFKSEYLFPIFYYSDLKKVHYPKMATKRVVRRVNPDKEASRESKKQSASEGVAKARKRSGDATKRREQKAAKRNELKQRREAASEEEKRKIDEELKTLEHDIEMEDAEISKAEHDVTKYQQQENEAAAEDVTDEMEIDDEDNADNPKPTTEGSGAAGSSNSTNPHATTGGSGPSPTNTSTNELAEAFLSGKAPNKNLWTPLDLSYSAGLLSSQKVVSYKSSGLHGKVAIVIDTEIPGCPIFRIRKNVIVPKGVPNIMDTRRAGKKKPGTQENWTLDDLDEVVGIAISVPPGYGGNVENLVKALPKLSLEEKVELRKDGKPIPRQPDVQLIIQWKEPIEITVPGEPAPRKVFLSYESRTGCKILWKKNGNVTLDTAAAHWEGRYRKAGGTHQSEEREMTPFDAPPVGADFSRDSTADPEQQASTRTTPERVIPSTQTTSERVIPSTETPADPGQKPSSGSTPPPNKTDKAAKKEAFDRFKEDYLLGAGVDEWTELTPEQAATGVAAFRIFWDKESKASAT